MFTLQEFIYGASILKLKTFSFKNNFFELLVRLSRQEKKRPIINFYTKGFF